MSQVTITDSDLFELTCLVHNRWAAEYDSLKRVKGEKDDGSEPDYAQMHQIRLENHTKLEAKWKQFLDRMTKVCPKLEY